MKSHYLNHSLLVLLLSSSALVAATPTSGIWSQPSGGTSTPIHSEPAQPVQAAQPLIPMPGVFTERDAGTPISIPINGRFRVTFHTDSKVDPVGSFWRPVVGGNQNFHLMMRDKTTNNWFDKTGSEHQVSNALFAFKPLVVGQTELSFELVQWVPAASRSVNANGSAAGDFTVIRTVTFPVTVVDACDNSSAEAPVHGGTQSGVQTLKNDLSTTSW